MQLFEFQLLCSHLKYFLKCNRLCEWYKKKTNKRDINNVFIFAFVHEILEISPIFKDSKTAWKRNCQAFKDWRRIVNFNTSSKSSGPEWSPSMQTKCQIVYFTAYYWRSWHLLMIISIQGRSEGLLILIPRIHLVKHGM